MLTQHHTLEDDAVFPHLRRTDPGLAPVLDRLAQEHDTIHEVVERVDRALTAMIDRSDGVAELRQAVAQLDGALLSHLEYEEQQLVEPLSRYGFYPGQL